MRFAHIIQIMPGPRKTIYIIDGHAHFFRAYHAIRTRMVSPVTGEPTHATFGFLGMLFKLLRESKPDYLAVVIDVSGDRESFRSEIYPQYKATRKEAPEDLHPQVERCVKLLRCMHVPVLGIEGVEADDVIATLVHKLKAENPDVEVRIVSRDKDLTQLISDRVAMLDVYKDETVGPTQVFGVEGITPAQVGDVLALMGDAVDNIPGVPGIGPKTAGELIVKYRSIDNLYANIEDIKGKKRENLEANREQVAISRQLVQLREDLDVDFDLDDARFEASKLPVGELQPMLKELGFNRFIDELRALCGEAERGVDASAAQTRGEKSAAAAVTKHVIGDSLFEQTAEGAAAGMMGPRDPGEYKGITTKAELDDLIRKLRKAKKFAIDTETDDIQPVRAGLCGVSIAIQEREAWYIPARSPDHEHHLDARTVVDALRPLLEDPKFEITGHNLKFDVNVFRRAGVNVRARQFDTMIASYVVDATRASHSLDVLSLALLNHTCIPISDLIGKGKKQKCFDTVPLAQAVEYAAEDADMALRLRGKLEPQINAMGLRELFDDVEMPLVDVLAELEYNGIRIDPDELDRQREKLAKRIEELKGEISDAAPHPFNPDSPKQLAAVLFNKPTAETPGLGIRPLKRGKTGPSTDQEVLEKLAADATIASPVPQLIVEYRQLTKLVSTYLVALKDAINPETGRVHASFNQTVAATGRLSSSDPNLQNIPIRSDVGREIRRAFVADPGNVLITADYSQIELRLLAHLSEDPALIDAFQRGADIHNEVAAEVFGVSPKDVTPAQRNSAKMVNFGIVYGITPYGLARRLGPESSVEQATQIIDNYKRRFSSIGQFLQACVDQAHKYGYVETILKRRRAIPQITSRQPNIRSLGERMAINTVVQGSAADLIKIAMIDLYRQLPDTFPGGGKAGAARMILQIHDELVFEAPQKQAKKVADFVVDRMQNAMRLKVPLVVGSAWSHNWIDAK